MTTASSRQASKNEETVHRFFAILEDHTPDLFSEVISPDYRGLGHAPPGIGPQGAHDDYDVFNAASGEVSYDAFVSNDGPVAVLWTETMAHTGTFVVGEPRVPIPGGA